MSLNRIKTPCVGVCSTTFGDTVCRGCRRFLHEVVNWNGYSEAQKAIVWRRLDNFMTLVVNNYFLVDDPARLRSQLDYQNIRYQPQLSAEGWVPELLKAAGQQAIDWQDYGLIATSQAGGATPRQLYERIGVELHALAQAHYERCYSRPARSLEELLTAGDGPGNDGAPGGT